LWKVCEVEVQRELRLPPIPPDKTKKPRMTCGRQTFFGNYYIVSARLSTFVSALRTRCSHASDAALDKRQEERRFRSWLSWLGADVSRPFAGPQSGMLRAISHDVSKALSHHVFAVRSIVLGPEIDIDHQMFWM
jgi:hypothetical protein